MKLLYISNARLPTEKAHGYQIMKMCEAFALNGLDVTLFHPYRKQSDKSFRINPFVYYKINSIFRIKTIKGFDGLAYLPKKLMKLGFFLHSIIHALLVTLETRIYWKDPNALYYSRDKYSIILLLLFRTFIKGRIVFEAHSFPESKTNMLMRYFRKLDSLVTITNQLKDMFKTKGINDKKILVAHDGVDLNSFQLDISMKEARYKAGIPTENPIATYVGKFHTMGMEKGIPEIIVGSKYLIHDFPDLLFYFIGGPLERVPKYEEIIKEEGLPRNRYVFIDKQPINMVPYFLKSSNVLLMPFPYNKHFAYYMSPLKMFEYMASGRPIIASKLPTIMEVLEHNKNALLGEPGDPLSIANNIKTALTEHNLAKKIADQSYKDVLNYTWFDRAKNILSFINNN